MKIPCPQFLALITAMAWGTCAAAGTDPVELMRKVQDNMSPPDETVELTMDLIEDGSVTSHREAVFYQRRKSKAGTEDMKLIRFSTPPELDGSAVLTLENGQRADDQWLYLPAYHTSRKIPSSNRADRYMGTDFFYEDVSDDKLDQYRFSVVGEEGIDGRNYTILEQVPEAKQVVEESAYGRKRLWVDPERLVIGRTDFFDKSGKLMKRLVSTVPDQIEGRWRWKQTLMQDLRTGHETVIQYSKRQLNQGLSPILFTVRSLERGR